MTFLLDQLLFHSANRDARAPALTLLDRSMSYGELADQVERFAGGLVRVGVARWAAGSGTGCTVM